LPLKIIVLKYSRFEMDFEDNTDTLLLLRSKNMSELPSVEEEYIFTNQLLLTFK
jgi:hypothetical protein